MEENNEHANPVDQPKVEPTNDSMEKKVEPQVEAKPVEEKPVEKSEAKPVNWKLFGIIAGVIVILIVAFMLFKSFTGPTGNVVADTNTPSTTSEVAKLDFYVMSQCPYGTQVEDAIAPVLNKLSSNIEFNLNYIATDLGDGTFQSLHGEAEVQGDIVQLCAAKYNPNKYMDMIVCQNKDARSIPGNYEQCAKDNGLDVEKIKACFDGEEGKSLLSENVKLATAVGARGSPTIYLNDQAYAGGRGEVDFMREICNQFTTKPQACSEIPEPKKVTAIILNDKRCETCTTVTLETQLKSLFPGIEFEKLDYNDEAGKAMYDSLGLSTLPAYLFLDDVKDGEGYAQIQNYLEPKGDKLNLRVGSTWDPNKEICDNLKDDNGDGYIDCSDDTCANDIACMQKKAVPEVELFVMSHCPYGTQTEKGALPVMKLLGDKADFQIKFVSYSMHGEKELDEELLQYCVEEEQNDKWLDYLQCFLDAGETDKCVKQSGLDKTKLDACIDKTDKEYKVKELFADKTTWSGGRYPQFNVHKTENEKYGIQGSPGLALNGVKIDSFGRDSASLLALVCNGFEEKPSECSETLSNVAPSAGFGFNAAPTAAAASAPATGGCGV